ncbi:MAG TPA: peroxide stress protein YaaA, partial [Solirubrobacterales bacterium]|nr:peroxide stress protein YaaA [Solirubrobacterales bacterium]
SSSVGCRPMLVLLPPSEGKTAPESGEPVDLDSLVFAEEVSEKREQVLDALDPGLRKAPAAPAAEVYTGVLFKRLELPRLPMKARRRVLIASALWGVVRPDDRIPRYKLPPKQKLDGIGSLAKFWRPVLAEALPDKEGELIVDMRSGAYSAMWKPRRATLLPVRAFTESDGERKAVSHMAKAVRGDVARALLEAKKAPADPEVAAAITEAAGFTVEVNDGTLDVIV